MSSGEHSRVCTGPGRMLNEQRKLFDQLYGEAKSMGAEQEMYNNPAASDFDDWNAPGWSFEELRPYIKRVSPPSEVSWRLIWQSEAWDVSANGTHGKEGNMPVTTRR